MHLSEDDARLILGALDSLGSALADYSHEWTAGERAIYEAAVALLDVEDPSAYRERPTPEP